MRASGSFWWIIEVGLPALGVLGGTTLLAAAALADVTRALARAEVFRLFWTGAALWGGGIAWGLFVNDGVGLKRWLLAR